MSRTPDSKYESMVERQDLLEGDERLPKMTIDDLICWCEQEAKASLEPPVSIIFNTNFLMIKDALLRLKTLEHASDIKRGRYCRISGGI